MMRRARGRFFQGNDGQRHPGSVKKDHGGESQSS